MGLATAWRDWRWSRQDARRFCRRIRLEGWPLLADQLGGALVLVPRAGHWRCALRALELYRQAESLPAAEKAAIAAALARGATVAVVVDEGMEEPAAGPCLWLRTTPEGGRLRLAFDAMGFPDLG
jgi:hypothetical protein